MNDTERGQHPDEPAEGPDVDEQATDADQRQNQERELNDGDEVTQPGGDEPTD